MPLVVNARRIMRVNLEKIRDLGIPKLIVIGSLTFEQLAAINDNRARQELPPIRGEVVFLGRHIYKSRILGDGYSIEDVLDQIYSAMDSAAALVETLKMTGIENPNPRPELFSVIPKGDRYKPTPQK